MFEKRKDSKTDHDYAPETLAKEAPRASSAPAPARKPAVIGERIHITGDITGDEDLLIEGKVDGKVDLESHQVEVGPTGEVTADIIAKVVRISGTVKGDIDGKEKVIILSSGNVQGNLKAPRVRLEEGGLFKGTIDMSAAEKAAELPLKAVKKPEPKEEEPESKQTSFAVKGG